MNLIDWYWQYGVMRGQDPADPDRELRKMPIGMWLDSAVRLLDRRERILSNGSGRACIALWGPSQTGKSTLLSRYIDGFAEDGSDSALTWNPAHPVRFSPSVELGASLAAIYPNTLVFNPYHHHSDASGVATRYTVRADDDATVDKNFPVEVRLASRVQVIHALSRGYLSECNPEGENIVYQQDAWVDRFTGEKDPQRLPDSATYSLLRDMASVLESMENTSRFNNLFRNGSWERRVRPAIVSSSACATTQEAEDCLCEVFWDASVPLSNLYRSIESLRGDLRAKWGESPRILAEPEVAALLLDIDSYRSFLSPGVDRSVQDKVSRLQWQRDASTGIVRLSIGASGSPEISGKAFGYFQVLIAELVVPMRRSALAAPGKEAFASLVDKADLLDFPGLSNVNKGSETGVVTETRLDLALVSEADLLTRVFKEGKTQSFVHNYTHSYGIDAFIVLARTDRPPSKSDILSEGIGTWLRSYDPEWKPGAAAPMPVFLDVTFLADTLNGIALNGIGSDGLSPIVSRMQDNLSFAGRGGARWFVTTYPQFPGGKVDNPDNPGMRNRTIDSMLADTAFSKATQFTREALSSVYEDDGGVGYMLRCIEAELRPERRTARCREILSRDWGVLSQSILRHLPTEGDAGAEGRRQTIRKCREGILQELDRIEQQGEGPGGYADLAAHLKRLFGAPSTMFDPIPFKASDAGQQLDSYLKAQFLKWYSNRMECVEDSPVLGLSQQQEILATLRDALTIAPLKRYLKTSLGSISDRRTAEAARFPFSMAFANLLLCGSCERESTAVIGEANPALLDELLRAKDTEDSVKSLSPYYLSVILPVLKRLETLQEVAVCGARPPQPGDVELAAVYEELKKSATL